MSKLFIIRDDDMNYFSLPEDIEYWYGSLFAENVPVSFSAIPFVKKTSDVYTSRQDIENGKKEYPIGENKTLVQYIKSRSSLIEIVQHGCTHETQSGIFEFKKHHGLFEEARRGYEYLKSIFGEVKVFVAPHDSFSNHGIKAVENIGLNIIRSKGFRNFIFRREYFIGIIRMIIHRVKHPNRFTAPAYPYIIDLGKHKEAYSHRLTKDKELLKKWLYFSARKGGNFILVNHLHDRDREMKEILLFAVEEAKKLGFIFTKASELFI